jgi:WD40 repeat protein
VAVSGDHAWLARVTKNGEIWRRSLTEADAEPELIGSRGHDLWSAALNSDGTLLATAGSDGKGEAWLWHLPESTIDTPVKSEMIPDTSLAWTVAFSPNDEWLAIGCADGAIRLVRLPEIDNSTAFDPYGVRRKNRCMEVQDASASADESAAGPLRAVRALAFSPDSQSLASGGHDRTVRLWQNLDGPRVTVTTIGSHNGTVRALAFHPDGNLLASGGLDQTVRLWRPQRPDLGGASLGEEEDWIRALAFSDDGRLLAAPSYDGSVRLWAGSAQLLAGEVCSRIWWDDETERAWDAIQERLAGEQEWWEAAWDRLRGRGPNDRPPCESTATSN